MSIGGLLHVLYWTLGFHYQIVLVVVFNHIHTLLHSELFVRIWVEF